MKEGNLKQLIKFLDEIEKYQIEKEKENYEKEPITRLIYGNQFNTIFKYIKYNFTEEYKEMKDFDEIKKIIKKKFYI